MFPSFSAANDSKERVRSSAMQLLVCRRFGSRESRHRQELNEELRAEMPPCMPEKIFRRRREPADRRAFQVRMELVDNDERFRSFPALLNDAQRVATMEQHGCHHGDVEFS